MEWKQNSADRLPKLFYAGRKLKQGPKHTGQTKAEAGKKESKEIVALDGNKIGVYQQRRKHPITIITA